MLAPLPRQARLGATGHLHHHPLGIPVGFADEVLQLLVITVGNALLHTLCGVARAIAFTLVEKAFQVLGATGNAVLAPASEIPIVRLGIVLNFFSFSSTCSKEYKLSHVF